MTNKQSLCLYLDIGNTRTKWLLIDSNITAEFNDSGALPHSELIIGQSLDLIKSKLEFTQKPKDIVCVSVANQEITDEWQKSLQDIWPNANWHRFSSSENSCGVINQYNNPKSLGADRWAGMIGAKTIYPLEDVLVVNAGTATTIDYINRSGEFTGGWIIPGLSLMLGSLARGTADLPDLSPANASKPNFGQSTNDCMMQGCIQAQIGAILRAIELTKKPTKLILSGGNSEYLAKQLSLSLPPEVTFDIDKQLVLRGLQTWFNQITKK